MSSISVGQIVNETFFLWRFLNISSTYVIQILQQVYDNNNFTNANIMSRAHPPVLMKESIWTYTEETENSEHTEP